MKQSIPVIMKMLEIDTNLSKMHSKLSPKMDENIFWKNYFNRIAYLRAAIGIDGDDAKCTLGSIPEDQVIFKYHIDSSIAVPTISAVTSFNVCT